ncbi:hypothetical protein T09_10539 [Trichinella sp. T9]|nr:hypothetical protein T09_10539 [Trichinella sp. T9]
MEFFKLAFFDYYPIFCDSQLIAVHVVGELLLPYIFYFLAAFKENHAITSVYLMQMVDCFGRLKEIYVSYVCSKN